MDGEEHRLRLEIDAGGALRSVTTLRWSNPDGIGWGLYQCGGALEDEVEVDGITIPKRMRVGYFFGTDRWGEGEFFRARITRARYL